MPSRKKKQTTGLQRVVDGLAARVMGGDSKRSRAGVKASLTRKRNERKRSASARKGAATRARGKRR